MNNINKKRKAEFNTNNPDQLCEKIPKTSKNINNNSHISIEISTVEHNFSNFLIETFVQENNEFNLTNLNNQSFAAITGKYIYKTRSVSKSIQESEIKQNEIHKLNSNKSNQKITQINKNKIIYQKSSVTKNLI